jgi:type I restriction enzyme R subunit
MSSDKTSVTANERKYKTSEQKEQSRAQQLMGDFASKLAELTDDVLFGDVWQRTESSPRDRSLTPPADISAVMGAVEELLDDSFVQSKAGYVIREPASGGCYLDLSRIDFKALRAQFAKSRKHIEVEKLRGGINSKLAQLIRFNKSRINYYQKFQDLINEYNAGAKNIDAVYAELLSFA